MHCPTKALRSLAAVVVLFFIAVSVSFGADNVPAKVVGITDGDTIKAIVGGEEIKIRLYGIDAPEKAQPYGQVATEAMKQLTTGHNITVEAIDRDRYGRTVAMVYADGTNVNESMIKSGNAWVYKQYCTKPFCSDWIQYQETAKDGRKGLWQDNNHIATWEWRHHGKQGRIQVVSLTTEAPEKHNVKPDIAANYSGNIKSRKFHVPGCQHYNCKNCTAAFNTREHAIAAGYSPCKICNP